MLTDWHSLGDAPYRKWHIYDMGWGELDIENYHISGAPFGGPLAMIRNEKKQPAQTKKEDSKLRIFSSSGNKLAEVDWDNRRVAGMGWSEQEQLVIVLEDGNVLIYDIHGKLVTSLLLLDVQTTALVLECHFWGNGVAAITSDMQIYVVEGLSSTDPNSPPRRVKFRTGLTPERPYTSMTIIPPYLSRSGILEVLIGTRDNSVLVVDENEAEDQLLQNRISAPISRMSVAPNGRFLACYRSDGVLTVMSSTFTSKVLDFDTKSMTRPLEIAWCGEDAVLMVWKNTGIVMVGPYGDWLNFPSDSPLHLVAEADCCRIISSTSCEMLQRVPPTTESIRRIGSTDPAALMYDAMEAFEEGDPKSDENIRSIAATNQLGDAVLSCISAAASEFDISRQQSLLKAASYGKAFCSDVDPTEFVETARKLRVLNEVRKPEIGLPLTMQQYNRLTGGVLVSRLTMRKHHYLALKICELLKLKTEGVLAHWAAEKVRKMATENVTDESIRDTIKAKLSAYARISYLDVAQAAYQMGRRRLATMILDMEPHAADQVPLLLSMNEEELALQKAINSEDTDLIYLTLIHLERSRPNSESFIRLILSHPEATNLLKMYYKNKITSSDRSILHNLLMHSRNYLDAGVAALNQAYQQGDASPVIKMQLMREAVTIFGQNTRDLSFYKTMTEEQVELLEIQKALELRSQRDFVDLSVTETINNLVLLTLEFPSEVSKWEGEIQKIVKKFKVSEKSLWHIKINCYSKTGQWASLARLSGERKSPVGYKPFAQACIKYNQPLSEIEKYVEKISIPEEKFEMYFDLKAWRKAGDVAIRMKDPDRLIEVGKACRDPALEKSIQEALNRM